VDWIIIKAVMRRVRLLSLEDTRVVPFRSGRNNLMRAMDLHSSSGFGFVLPLPFRLRTSVV
jgi:hypothetical protein